MMLYNNLFPFFMHKKAIKNLQNFSNKLAILNVTKEAKIVIRDIIAGINNLKAKRAIKMVSNCPMIQSVSFSGYHVLVWHNNLITHDFIHQQLLRELLKWNLKTRNHR